MEHKEHLVRLVIAQLSVGTDALSTLPILHHLDILT